MLQFMAPSVVPIQPPAGHAMNKFTQMILIQRKKKKKVFFSRLRYFQSSGFPHGQGRDGTALLLSWKWMAGGGQKLIKLALATDMNCGIAPRIASNPISLAQLVMRSWDEFQPAMKHSSWTCTRKSIHQTVILNQVLLVFFIQGPAFPTGLLPKLFHLNFSCWTILLF